MCVWKVAPEDRLCKLCRLDGCEDRIPPARRLGKVMSRVRQMEVGEEIFVPRQEHNAARTAATKLNKVFGVKYKVCRAGDSISVVRIY